MSSRFEFKRVRFQGAIYIVFYDDRGNIMGIESDDPIYHKYPVSKIINEPRNIPNLLKMNIHTFCE